MSVSTEKRPSTLTVSVYRCDRCDAHLGDDNLGNGYSLNTTLYPDPKFGHPSTPPYRKDWHWELCARCFGWLVNNIGKGEQP